MNRQPISCKCKGCVKTDLTFSQMTKRFACTSGFRLRMNNEIECTPCTKTQTAHPNTHRALLPPHSLGGVCSEYCCNSPVPFLAACLKRLQHQSRVRSRIRLKTSDPTWLNDGRIALLQYPNSGDAGPKAVIHYARTGSVSEVPLIHSGKFYTLASVTKDDNNQRVLRTFSIEGEVLSQAIIQRLPHHSVYGSLSIRFAPDGESFLTSPGEQINALSLEGELTLLHNDNIDGLSNPVYHTSQTKIIATQGTKDFDIDVLNVNENDAAISAMARSTKLLAIASHSKND